MLNWTQKQCPSRSSGRARPKSSLQILRFQSDLQVHCLMLFLISPFPFYLLLLLSGLCIYIYIYRSLSNIYIDIYLIYSLYFMCVSMCLCMYMGMNLCLGHQWSLRLWRSIHIGQQDMYYFISLRAFFIFGHH